MKKISLSEFGFFTAACLALSAPAQAVENEAALKRAVDEAILPVMKENNLPGVAVAVTSGGKNYFFNYGVASKESGKKVTENTIFEIGSISKTFAGTLGAYAQASGSLSLADNASKYWPELAGSSFDKISLIDLATYTAGGLPLQFPDSAATQKTILDYYRNWRPTYPAGTHRQYSNPSIGLFGHLAARSMNEPYDALMQKKLLPMLGLSETYTKVPENRMGDYAYGYLKDGKPVRVKPNFMASEIYGMKTTAADLIKFVEDNIDPSKLDPTLQNAIAATHTGYYRIGPMTQGLGWELYPAGVPLDQLLDGNSTDMARKANKAELLTPPQEPMKDLLINKTGSTNGFGAYAAFIPAKNIGVVILANKVYPNGERVKAGYRILQALEGEK